MVNRPAPPIVGEAEFWAGVANAQRFFMGNAEIQYALQKLIGVLNGTDPVSGPAPWPEARNHHHGLLLLRAR
jgi:hypothetical protein